MFIMISMDTPTHGEENIPLIHTHTPTLLPNDNVVGKH